MTNHELPFHLANVQVYSYDHLLKLEKLAWDSKYIWPNCFARTCRNIWPLEVANIFEIFGGREYAYRSTYSYSGGRIVYNWGKHRSNYSYSGGRIVIIAVNIEVTIVIGDEG